MLKPAVIILAAGKGTRMRSELPKALHPICGRPMLWHLLRRAEEIGAKKIVVVGGHGFGLVKGLVGRAATLVRQAEQRGSGHAVRQAEKALKDFNGPVVVLYCDTPLVQADSIRTLLDDHRKKGTECTLLSVDLSDPSGYGRIVRGRNGDLKAIVEHNDAGPAERRIREINVGAYVFRSKKLFGALKSVLPNPVKNEIYLTDAVGLLAREGRVTAVKTRDTRQMLGVNTLKDLTTLEGHMQEKILNKLVEKGVRIRDPRTTSIDADVTIGEGTVVFPNTVIEEGTKIGKGCRIGPFARLRGRSVIADGAVIGNFVEVVRSTVGKRTQVKHLSYLGDAKVGDDVNIGCGTITANFDGKKKHTTVIKDRAQTGSGTVLVAPVTVGRGAKTGAGAVVPKGKNVPDGAVVVGVPARKIKK